MIYSSNDMGSEEKVKMIKATSDLKYDHPLINYRTIILSSKQYKYPASQQIYTTFQPFDLVTTLV